MFQELNKTINRFPLISNIKSWSYSYLAFSFFKKVQKDPGKTIFIISGLRRSGNHAIINWLFHQCGNLSFLNNIGPHQEVKRLRYKKFKLGSKPNRLMVSYEDKPSNESVFKKNESRFGSSQKVYTLLILRDPFNLIASRIAWKDAQGKEFREDVTHRKHIIALWKEHAKAFIEILENPRETSLAINYNQWFQDLDYRKSISRKLGLEFSDGGKEWVTPYGHGSSFDGTKMHDKGSELQVLNRYKKLLSDPIFKECLLDMELNELAAQIFPEINKEIQEAF